MLGKTINKYRIDAKLGEGGMGVVYKAWHIVLERPVALKMLHPALAQDEKLLQRFLVEGRALAKLVHPNIVTVFDLEEAEQNLIIIMEYVEGETLAAMLQPHAPLPLDLALPMMKQMLTAFGEAHKTGVIHRDIKPGNVMLTPQGQVKITDFGLAKVYSDRNLTQTASTGGTLFYMSPEQMQSFSKVDRRSDIYSIGMTFYEMLAGRLPFEKSENMYAVLKDIVESEFPSPDHFNLAAPKELSQIVMKALAKKPAQRYQSAEEMLAAITRFERGQAPTASLLPRLVPPLKTRTRRAPAYVALVILVLISGVVFFSPELRQRLFKVFADPELETLPAVNKPDSTSVSKTDSLTEKPVEKLNAEKLPLDDKIQKNEPKKPVVSKTRKESQAFEPLARAPGKLHVLVRPFGAIYIDEARVQEETDILFKTALAAGSHRLKLVHPQHGYWEEEVEIKPDSLHVINIDFNKKVKITVAAPAVSWAKIYVDNMDTGLQTTSEVEFRVGTHLIEVRREGYVFEGKKINFIAAGKAPLIFTPKARP